jgi:integrase
MAYLRKLPSGLWQATYRGGDGKKHTKTDPLKKVVKDWAADEESKVAQGLWRDPRLGRQTVATWCTKWFAARVVEDSTRRGDRSCLDNHVLPRWGSWSLSAITPLDVQLWIRRLEKADVGPHAIRHAYNLFSSLMRDAVTARVLAESPVRDVDKPDVTPKLPAWFTREQVDRIHAEFLRRRRPGHAAMTELMVCVGLRFGEAAAACGGERPDGNPVDWLRGRIRIVGVLTENGRWKTHPKNSKSRREVPLPAHCLAEMGALLTGRDRTARVFLSPQGQPIQAANWRRLWYAVIASCEGVPAYDPHDCRHTAASWLAQDGVPLYDIGELLGHESPATTQRYAHLAKGAHSKVEDAWTRILAHQRRTDGQRINEDRA